MFKEGKGLAAPARFSSPLVRRKMPGHSCSTQYTPLSGRKSRLPGLGIMKKKGSVPDDLLPSATSQEPSALTPLIARSFSEDPRHVQIKEQVSTNEYYKSTWIVTGVRLEWMYVNIITYVCHMQECLCY